MFFDLLALVIIALTVANELGIGIIVFLPLILVAYWMMRKAFRKGMPIF